VELGFDELLGLASSDPAAALKEVEAALIDDDDPVFLARALRVTGLARANLGELRLAQLDIDEALQAAERSGDRTVLGETLMTRAGILAWSGQQDESLEAIDAAFELLEGAQKAMAQAQRGGIHYRLGSFALARLDLDDAIGALDAAGETMWWGHAMTNRGLLNAYEGKVDAARADLQAAKSGYSELAHRTSMAHADQNLGWLALRSGDFPGALNFLEEAEAAFDELGTSLGQLWCDRAEVLLAAHMATDAKHVAIRAAQELRDKGLQASYADALLQAAQAALLSKDAETATEAARVALRLMEEQGRDGWAAFAEYLIMRARAIDDDLGGADLPAIAEVVKSLDSSGLHTEALHARLLAATVATAAGDYAACRAYLVAASKARDAGPVELRVQGWVAMARLRLHAQDSRGAASAARAGLRVLSDYQATLGGTLARLHVSGHGAELASIGLRLARESGSARRLFDWMELTRAGALRSQPGGGGVDEHLSSHLMMFREADEQLRRATLNGESAHSLHQRRLELQERVRNVALRKAVRSSDRLHNPRAAEVLEVLEGRTLVEFGESEDGDLLAVRLSGGRARRFELGPIAVVRQHLDSLAMALRRIAVRSGSEASRAAALAVVADAAQQLNLLLIEPLRLDGAPIAIVPVGPLYSLPWPLLPRLAAAELVVSPSAALWVQRARRPLERPTEASVIAGPRLDFSSEEVARVAAVYERSLELVEPTAEAASRAIDGATIAHVACHGSFRADNPLFSSLEMADGPLTIYDLEAVTSAPDMMVLSACDAGANTSSGGDEVMGLATALLGQGTRSVVANVGLVPDQLATIDLMVAVHENLAAGDPLPVALAAALPALSYEDPDAVAARSFVTFGG